MTRDATAADLALLNVIAHRSKAHWGYDEAFMEACRDELRVPASALEREIVRVHESDDKVVGFYRLAFEDEEAEIEAFYVDPERIGSGVGRVLWDDLVGKARTGKAARLVSQSDPFAEGFYLAMGMTRIGERASDSIPGRMLPLLEMSL